MTKPRSRSIEKGAHTSAEQVLVRARIHDRKSPSLAADWAHVEVRWLLGDESGVTPMRWYGEYLWSGSVPASARELRVCAADLSENETCSVIQPDS